MGPLSLISGFLVFLGSFFLLFGGASYLIRRLKPVGASPRRRPSYVIANDMARNLQTISLPMMGVATILIVLGLIGIFIARL